MLPRVPRLLRIGLLTAAASGSTLACLDEPAFVVARSDVAASNPAAAFDGRPPPSPEDEPMVRIGTTPLDAAGNVTPAGKPEDTPGQGNGNGNGNGKGQGNGKPPKDKPGKGGGGGDAGGSSDPGTTAPDAGSSAPPSTPRLVAALWIDAYEVGAAAYAGCVAAGVCKAPPGGDGCTLAAGLSAHPVTCVTIEDARAYCGYRGKRLLTEDEWLAAAAGATGRRYPWGDDAPTAEHANACGPECRTPGMYEVSDGFARTAPRGLFARGRTTEGAFDLAGNVAEWISSARGALVVGGSYDDTAPGALSASSAHVTEAASSPRVGFRCAKDDR